MGSAPSCTDGRIYISTHTYMCISVTKAQRTKATSPKARKPDRGGCSVVILFLKTQWAAVQLELAPAPHPLQHGARILPAALPRDLPLGLPEQIGFHQERPRNSGGCIPAPSTLCALWQTLAQKFNAKQVCSARSQRHGVGMP